MDVPRVFYGVSGEGLGHTSRALSVIDRLGDHEVHLFTFGKGYQFLKDMGYPHLHEIKGQMFAHNKSGSVNYVKTLWKNRGFLLRGLRENVDYIVQQAKELSPKLMICDFEPSISRAARKAGVPYITVDNQHRFSHCYKKDLPAFLRWYSWFTGVYTEWIAPRPDKIVISTFHYDDPDLVVRKERGKVWLVNGLMRRSIENTQTSNGKFVLVYLNEVVQEKILESLKDVTKEVRIYGAKNVSLQQLVSKPNFEYFELSPAFTEDLAACSDLICTAGNQLISEARFYEKPVLVIPQPRQWEQNVNAHYVEKMGMGESCELKNLTPEVANRFLEEFEIQCGTAPNGSHEVERIIRRYTTG